MTTQTLAQQIEAIEDYQEKANEFCRITNTEVSAKFIEKGLHFDDDKEKRDIYDITVKTNRGIMKVRYGQSMINSEHWTAKDVFEYTKKDGGKGYTTNMMAANNGLYRFHTLAEAMGKSLSFNKPIHHKKKTPSAYDVLTCLTKYHPGNFEDFCSEFGYSTDSKRAEKTYYAVLKEYADVSSIFTVEQIEALHEIQ